MSYVKKTYAEGSLVTPEDMNRIETGIEDNANKMNGIETGIEDNANKINILSTITVVTPIPEAGYKLVGNYSKKIGNIYVYDFQIQKTDGTAFDVNTSLKVATLPNYNTTTPFVFCGVGQYFMSGAACNVNDSLYLTCNTANISTIRLCGVMII